MKKYLFAICTAIAGIGLQASNVSAQSNGNCCCGSVTLPTPSPSSMTNQAYQRFSYDPTSSISSMPLQNMGGVVQNQPSFVQSTPATQSYRRFSYRPTVNNRSNGSGQRKELWEYSKGDPRKQQH